ncbi:MAG: HTH domain-containing protein [Gallionellaceae bacterium]|nr:HTH domain-containing protein [Gallionellaceae bacterium]
MKTILKVESVEEFFKRGKAIAKLADKGRQIPREKVISFEDPQDLASLVTTAKLALFREVRECPGSISDLSGRLHRDRSAVKRDIDELKRFGLVEVEDVPFPGHGRKKEVRALAEQVLLAV